MRPRTLFISILAAGLLVQSGAAVPIDPKNPPQGRFADEWAELHMAGGKVGYAHSTMTREGDTIITGTRFVMKVGRVDAPVKIEIYQQTRETIDGVPLSFRSETDASVMKSSTSGVIEQGKVTITTAQYGMEQKKTFDFPAGALMNWGILRENLLRGFKPGTKYALQTYAPEIRYDTAIPSMTEIGDVEPLPRALPSGPTTGQRVTARLESPAGALEMISWVDPDGQVLFAKVPLPGLGDILMIRSDQGTAMGDFVPPELFMQSMIRSPRKIDRTKTSQITYRLSARTADAKLSDLPQTDMQRIARKTDGTVELVVSRQRHERHPSNADAPPLSPEALREYFDPNLMMNTEDPVLRELAAKAAGDEKDPYKLADTLRRFVTDYVASKTLNVGFATASEVARTKEGDCSEHGVLLAALARIKGLPSRVVVGIAYVPIFGNADDVFGYHLWTQVYIDGRWIDLDSALRETQCSPARVAFAVSSLRDAGIADISLPLISKIGSLDLEILDLKEAP